ncbi:competence protein ComGC [Lacticaseibacillus rhamnosus]|uniref:competence type IV pilus minor pilin ComGF n=1 Tax=Lacticaseibacillus rhamnosus TaxID=47715 RepID=UPI00237F99CF|nr:competence type IV pilus minor pilin ComGF [Lacticaseibacillus rhamnosus]MDE3293380.1 competence protein ComGC [Lacticaseibacillus rhamnosus]
MPITRRPAIPLTLSAFTLIEVVIGLGIMIAVMLLWSPLLTGIQQFTNQDQYLLHALQADADLQANVRTHRMKLETLKQKQVRLQGKDGDQSKFYVFEFYTKNGNSMIRARTNDEGHIPLFMQIKSAQFRGSVHGFLYDIRVGTNQTFEGGVRLNQ